MKKITFLILLLASGISFGQSNVKITKSELITSKVGDIKAIVGTIAENLITIQSKTGKEGDYLVMYDSEMKEQSSSALIANHEDKEIVKPLIFQNQIYMLTILNKSKSENTTLSLEKYNSKSLEYENSITDVFTSAYIKFNPKTGFIKSQVLIAQSANDERLLILAYYDKKIYLSVLDPDLKEIWKKTVELKPEYENAKVKSLRVTNSGDVILLLNEYIGNVQHQTYNTFLLCLSESGGNRNEQSFEYSSKIYDIGIFSDQSDRHYLVGINGYDESFLPKNIFMSEIDVTNAKFKTERKIDFINKILPEKMGYKKRIKSTKEDFKKEGETDKYINRIDVVDLGNDKYYFVIEQFKKNINAGEIDYSTDNLYIHYSDFKAKEDWEEIISKEVRSTLGYYLSHVSLVINDKLYLLFNDCKENLKLTGDAEVTEYFVRPNCTFNGIIAEFDSKKFIKKDVFIDKELNHVLSTIFYKDKNGNYFFGCDGQVGTERTFGQMVVKTSKE